MLFNPDPAPRTTAKTQAASRLEPPKASTVTAIGSKADEMSVGTIGWFAWPTCMLTKRTSTCAGPNSIATATAASPRRSADRSGTICARMADSTNPPSAKAIATSTIARRWCASARGTGA